MAASYVQYTGNGATVLFTVTFPFISRAHVTFKVAGVDAAFSWINDTQVQATAAPANGSAVVIRRVTPSALQVTWATGGNVRSSDLNTQTKQDIYLAEEAQDDIDEVVTAQIALPVGTTLPLPIAQGGTAATSAAAARTSLGATTIGVNLFTAADAAAARAAIPLDTLIVSGTYTVDLAAIASASRVDSSDITATGAALGDIVKVWDPVSEQTQGLVFFGRVVSTNNIRILAFNPSAGSINLASCDFRWQVYRKAT